MRIGFWIYSAILVTVTISGNLGSGKSSSNKISYSYFNEYFPDNRAKVLVYNSDFGETKLTMDTEDKYDIYTLRSDNFIYRQKLLLNADGVFVKETYQKIKYLLVLSKEGNFTYNELMPRIKFPLIEGKAWSWEGQEYDNKDTSSISLTAKVENKEIIKVPAGSFETIKLITNIISSSGTRSTITEWFAKNIGLIKMSADIEGGGISGIARDLMGLGEIVFELKEIQIK